MTINRRMMLVGAAGAGAAAWIPGVMAAAAEPLKIIDGVSTELVMNLVVTCSNMIPTGGPEVKKAAKDGVRDQIWPIIGGRFWGKNIRGTVVPGGGDFPFDRPDGVTVVDALYRLRTDDGVTIIIHNKGLGYPPGGGHGESYRLQPEFFAPAGKYDWLNKSIFLATLVFPVPPEMAVATKADENDRLIQVYRVY